CERRDSHVTFARTGNDHVVVKTVVVEIASADGADRDGAEAVSSQWRCGGDERWAAVRKIGGALGSAGNLHAVQFDRGRIEIVVPGPLDADQIKAASRGAQSRNVHEPVAIVVEEREIVEHGILRWLGDDRGLERSGNDGAQFPRTRDDWSRKK